MAQDPPDAVDEPGDWAVTCAGSEAGMKPE